MKNETKTLLLNKVRLAISCGFAGLWSFLMSFVYASTVNQTQVTMAEVVAVVLSVLFFTVLLMGNSLYLLTQESIDGCEYR